MSKVLVDLKETKHISIVGGVGYGKTTYARRLVDMALDTYKDLNIVVYGARDETWEELEHMGLITLYSMEDTIKRVFMGEELESDSDKETLIVIDDIGYTMNMLPSSEHKSVIRRLHRVLTQPNIYSINTSLRPIGSYYPREILDLANTKIALNLGVESDYAQYFGTRGYLNNQNKPTNVAESYIDTKTTSLPVYIKSSHSITLK